MIGVASCNFSHLTAACAQMLEKDLGMLLFVICGLQENGGNVFKASLPGLAGIVGITVAGLRLPGESNEQVFSVCIPLKFTSFLQNGMRRGT